MHPTGSHEVIVAVSVFAVTVLFVLVSRLRDKLATFRMQVLFSEAARESAAKQAEHARREAAINETVLSVSEYAVSCLQEHIQTCDQTCSICGWFGCRPGEYAVRQFPDADGKQLIVECNDCIAAQYTDIPLTRSVGIGRPQLTPAQWEEYERAFASIQRQDDAMLNDIEVARIKRIVSESLNN